MLTRSAIILVFALLSGCQAVSQTHAGGSEDCADPLYSKNLTNKCRWQFIETIWAHESSWLENYVTTKLEAREGIGIYKVQQLTNSLFVEAVRYGRSDLIDQLAELYLIPAEYLREVTTYNYYNVPGGDGRVTELPLPEPTRLWLSTDYADDDDIELIIPSSQFLYLIANAIALIQTLPEQTPATRRLVDTYWPVLIDHYKRWIFAERGPFQVSGWGCRAGNFNMSEFVAAKLERSLYGPSSLSYCNAVTDRDLWIIAGTVELLAAHEEAPDQLPLGLKLRNDFLNFARQGVALIENRTKVTSLQDFDGRAVSGAVFDPGAWRDHPKAAYAGYDGEAFPTSEDRSIVERIGWDFNHAIRFVEVFGSLHDRRELLGTRFPDRDDMRGLANQLAYGIFNGDFERPLFANYFDGTNGWYRINYMKRVGFGYAPFDMSAAMMIGSYGRWSEFNEDVATIMKALWKMILSEEAAIMEHKRNHYEYRVYRNFERRPGDDIFNLSTSHRMLPYLSSFPFSHDM